MKIYVESTNIITKISKKGSPYFQQLVTVHKDGEKYPTEIPVFVSQNDPYPKGDYEIDLDKSLRTTSFGFDLGSIVLKPTKKVA